MKSARLFFLGVSQFERAGKPVQLTSAKAIALLGFLAVNREPQTRERVLGLLWAESPDDAARKNLRNALWAIRKTLGDDAVIGDADKLALGDSVWVDAREFEEISDLEPSARQSQTLAPSAKASVKNLKSIIETYRGIFLDGLALADAPEFEIWLTAERERLAQLHLRALGVLVDAYRANADWRAMRDAAQRAIAHDNLQEPMYRALMEAHARLGERAEAMRDYDALRAALERELGVEPLSETESLRAAIMAGTVQTLPVTSLQPRAKRAPAAPTRVPLVGRRAELDALEAELRAALNKTVRVVLIVGEIGIGKSRLWQEWSNRCENKDGVILETRCLDSTQALPFAPLAQLFSRADIARQLFSASSPVAPTWLAHVAQLLPDIRVARPDLPALPILPPDEERRRVFEAFAQCLLALARPLIIFVDDAHWADRATLDWLGFLAHRLRGQALLLVLAYRPEDASAHLVHLTAMLGREGVTHRLPLSRLTPEESAALIAMLGGDPNLAERAQMQSAGNPYFLIELLRAAPGDYPPALSELVRARLATLPEDARQIAQAASVIGLSFDFALLRRTSGRGEEETLNALDTLLNANVLVERERQYDFAHPLVAAIVRDELSHARRAFLHRRAADALQATHAGHLPEIAGQLATHYAQANDPPRAARFSELAAERALALAAPDEAIEFYRQSLAFEPTPTRRVGLGRVFLRQGDLGNARDAFETALREFEIAGDPRGAARAALINSETFFPSGRIEEGKQWIEKALTFLDTIDDPEAHAMAHLALGTGARDNAAAFAEAERNLREAIQHAQDHNLTDIGARSWFILGTLLAEHGDLGEAIHAYDASVAFARAAGNEFQEILGYNNIAYHALLAGDLAKAHASFEKGFALAESRALRLPLQYLYSTRGEIALAENQWDEAKNLFERGSVIAESVGNQEMVATYRANLALAARGRGDLDSALILLEDARDAAAGLNAPHLQTRIDLSLAEVYRARGERAAFEESLARAHTRLASSPRALLQAWARRLRDAAE